MYPVILNSCSEQMIYFHPIIVFIIGFCFIVMLIAATIAVCAMVYDMIRDILRGY